MAVEDNTVIEVTFSSDGTVVHTGFMAYYSISAPPTTPDPRTSPTTAPATTAPPTAPTTVPTTFPTTTSPPFFGKPTMYL